MSTHERALTCYYDNFVGYATFQTTKGYLVAFINMIVLFA